MWLPTEIIMYIGEGKIKGRELRAIQLNPIYILNRRKKDCCQTLVVNDQENERCQK